MLYAYHTVTDEQRCEQHLPMTWDAAQLLLHVRANVDDEVTHAGWAVIDMQADRNAEPMDRCSQCLDMADAAELVASALQQLALAWDNDTYERAKWAGQWPLSMSVDEAAAEMDAFANAVRHEGV